MLETASYSCQGGREYNEDSVAVWKDKGRLCVIVADGLGGHGGGEKASGTAADLMVSEYRKSRGKTRKEWIRFLYEKANKKILGQQSAKCRMKTTCVSLFQEEEQAAWAHVGDSRLYHFIDGKLAFVTSDHSVSQMAVLEGEITREQIRFHPDRNKVLRVLGTEENVNPDIHMEMLEKGAFHAFLLCTDGFWEYVLETEMEIDLAKADERNPELWLRYMMERLEKKVKGDNDNYSAAAVFYRSGN